MIRVLICLVGLWVSIPSFAQADETTRQIQEELRKRNLYFGNIDGQSSPVLIDALKTAITKREKRPPRKHGNIPL